MLRYAFVTVSKIKRLQFSKYTRSSAGVWVAATPVGLLIPLSSCFHGAAVGTEKMRPLLGALKNQLSGTEQAFCTEASFASPTLTS